MPDPRFQELYAATDRLTWASTDEVRRRGRQWARRGAVTAVSFALVAAAALAAGLVAAANARIVAPEPPATFSPPTSPATATTSPAREPIAIPIGAMLQGGDLAARFTPKDTNLDGDWSFLATTIRCGHQVRIDLPAPLASRGQRFQGNFDEPLIERVDRRPVPDAVAYLERIREQVETCNPSPQMQQSIVDEGFAGGGSLLIYTKVENVENLHIFVRRGGLVAEIWHKGLTDRDEARRLAARAAERLCVGTDTC